MSACIVSSLVLQNRVRTTGGPHTRASLAMGPEEVDTPVDRCRCCVYVSFVRRSLQHRYPTDLPHVAEPACEVGVCASPKARRSLTPKQTRRFRWSSLPIGSSLTFILDQMSPAESLHHDERSGSRCGTSAGWDHGSWERYSGVGQPHGGLSDR